MIGDYTDRTGNYTNRTIESIQTGQLWLYRHPNWDYTDRTINIKQTEQLRLNRQDNWN